MNRQATVHRSDAKDTKKGFVRARHCFHVVAWLALIILISSCAVVRATETRRIALFAPFEGRYREIGYNALYAVRLAVDESANGSVDLLAVDDGGTEAEHRALALAQDPLVLAVIALGYNATAPEVLRAFGDIPVLVVGEWGAAPTGNNVFIFSNPEIAEQISTPQRTGVTDAAELPAPVTGTDVFALEGFAKLRAKLDGMTVLSSGTLPDADFTARYRGDNPFAPEPGLLATLTFDATQLALRAAQSGERNAALRFLNEGTSNIHFQDGYWADAPLHRYVYVDGTLTEDAVEQR